MKFSILLMTLRLTMLALLPIAVCVVISSTPTAASPCTEGPNPPAGYDLVLCTTPDAGDILADLGWIANTEYWSVVEDKGKHWIEGTSQGTPYAHVIVPQMSNADQVVVEYTAYYVSTGNGWAMEFLSDQPEAVIGTNYMLLSAWNGLYFRMYDNSQPVADSTIISAPKIETGEVVTIRAEYDYTKKTIALYRNSELLPEYPLTLPDDYLIKGPEHNTVKLYVSTGGSAQTTARWTDIRVWVKTDTAM